MCKTIRTRTAHGEIDTIVCGLEGLRLLDQSSVSHFPTLLVPAGIAQPPLQELTSLGRQLDSIRDHHTTPM